MFVVGEVGLNNYKIHINSLVGCLLIFGLSSSPNPLSGQIVGGVFIERGLESSGDREGIGGELGFEVAFLPIDVFASGAHFPSTEQAEPSRVWSVGARTKIVFFPWAGPYIVGGQSLTESRASNVEVSQSEEGSFAGIGIDFKVKALRIYAEGKYEMFDESESFVRLRMGASLLWGGLSFW